MSDHGEQALGPLVVSSARTQGLVSLAHLQGGTQVLPGGRRGSPECGLAGLVSAQPLAPTALVLIAPNLEGGDFVTALLCLFCWAWGLSPASPLPRFLFTFCLSHLFTMILSVPFIFHFQKIQK